MNFPPYPGQYRHSFNDRNSGNRGNNSNNSGNSGNSGHGNGNTNSSFAMGSLPYEQQVSKRSSPAAHAEHNVEPRRTSASKRLRIEKFPVHSTNVESIFAPDGLTAQSDEVDMKDSDATGQEMIAPMATPHSGEVKKSVSDIMSSSSLANPTIQGKILAMLHQRFVEVHNQHKPLKAKYSSDPENSDLWHTKVPVKDENNESLKRVETSILEPKKWFQTVVADVMVAAGVKWIPWCVAVQPFLAVCVETRDRQDATLSWSAWACGMDGLIIGCKDGMILQLAGANRVLKSMNMSQADRRYINFLMDKSLFKSVMDNYGVSSQLVGQDGESDGVFEIRQFREIIETSCGLPSNYVSDDFFYCKLIGSYPNLGILDIKVMSLDGKEVCIKRVAVGLGYKTPLQHYCAVSLDRDAFDPTGDLVPRLHESFKILIESYVQSFGWRVVGIDSSFMENLCNLNVCSKYLKRGAWIADARRKGFYRRGVALQTQHKKNLPGYPDLTNLSDYSSLRCVSDVFLKIKSEKETNRKDLLNNLQGMKDISVADTKQLKQEAKEEVTKWEELYLRHRYVVLNNKTLYAIAFDYGPEVMSQELRRLKPDILEALLFEKNTNGQESDPQGEKRRQTHMEIDDATNENGNGNGNDGKVADVDNDDDGELF